MGSFVQFFEEEVGGDDIWDQILEFIIKNPNPKESAIHEFAEEHNMAPDKLEEQVYEILTDILTGGKSKGTDEGIDEEQLNKGIEVEGEHTKYKALRRKIALDHLAELPNYYDLLEKMEKNVKESRAYFYYEDCIVNEAGQSVLDMNVSEFVNTGIMKDNKDIDGLKKHLVRSGLIQKRDELVFGE